MRGGGVWACKHLCQTVKKNTDACTCAEIKTKLLLLEKCYLIIDHLTISLVLTTFGIRLKKFDFVHQTISRQLRGVHGLGMKLRLNVHVEHHAQRHGVWFRVESLIKSCTTLFDNHGYVCSIIPKIKIISTHTK